MRVRNYIACLAVLIAGMCPGAAQTMTDSSGLALPGWVKAGGEVGGRAERAAGNISGTGWMRFRIDLIPRPWLTLAAEVHEEAVSSPKLLRQAWAQIGNRESGWGLRAGRQELSFGDERLVGTACAWSNLGHRFDGAALTLRHGIFSADWFAARVREPADPTVFGASLFGMYSALRRGENVVEPYILIMRARTAVDLASQDVRTYGVRTAGAGPAGTDFNAEISLQSGESHRQPVRAWAGHWELGYRLDRDGRMPRIGISYDYASGDRDAADGIHTTFDDLYPADYNEFGLADPFGARNLRNLGATLGWTFNRRWSLDAAVRCFWLATVQDGLYAAGEEQMVRNTSASSSAAGLHASSGIGFSLSGRADLHVAVARFLPGRYLHQAGFRAGWTDCSLAWILRF